MKDILKKYDTKEEGLTSFEVEEKRKIYGFNELEKPKKKSIFYFFLTSFLDPITIILLFAALLSFVMGEYIDGISICFIVFLDMIIGSIQEYKAELSMESIASLMKDEVRVRRDKEELVIDSSNLVVGDIVLLESGDKIPADIIILESKNLQVDESTLTGESVSVRKDKEDNKLYMGCLISTGRCVGVVSAIGMQTELGSIASVMKETKEEKSPLTIRMEKFSVQISIIIAVIAICLFFILLARGMKVEEILFLVIALSISAMPEGLALARTMALTIASTRMTKKNVIVKKLNSVEALGSCSIIATDKTGTLTVNEQTAKKIVLKNGMTYSISGEGYNDIGEVTPSTSLSKVKELSKLCVLNNEAKLEYKKDHFEYIGDSIDVAFLALGMKLDIKAKEKVLSKIPYESEKGYSALFYEEDGIYCTVKGSFEKVISFCKGEDIEKLKKQNEALAQEGYRVIAVAKGVSKKVSDKIPTLEFLGFVAFIDPVRDGVKEAIEKVKSEGITPIMITGDHPSTAYFIASSIGICKEKDEVLTGVELEEALGRGYEYFDRFIDGKKVFSRVSPTLKLEIVSSLKRRGEFVAVTGDGVNDAPALKAANIGVAMGSGTDTAKEVSDMIIKDDNFTSIVAGITEGRCAYSNIRKICYLLLSCGFAEVMFFFFSIFLGLDAPLVAIQLLWLNVVTDGLQDMALSFEKPENVRMQNSKEGIFNKDFIIELLLSGAVITLLVTFLWYFLVSVLHYPLSLSRGYVMTLMVFIQNVHVLNCRSEKVSFMHVPILKNPMILVAVGSSILLQCIVCFVKPVATFFSVDVIPISHMFYLFIISLLILVVMDTYKRIRYGSYEVQKSK